jgi:hypothetical protein
LQWCIDLLISLSCGNQFYPHWSITQPSKVSAVAGIHATAASPHTKLGADLGVTPFTMLRSTHWAGPPGRAFFECGFSRFHHSPCGSAVKY